MLAARLKGAGGSVNSGETVSFVASAGDDAANLSVPATANSGDVAIAINVAASTSGVPSLVVPSGWTQIHTATQNNQYYRITAMYKILDSGDPGTSYTFMQSDFEVVLMAVFRKSSPITSVNVGYEYAAASFEDIPNVTMTSGSGTKPLIACVSFGLFNPAAQTRTISGATMTEITAGTSFFAIEYNYIVYNSSPSNITAGITDDAGNEQQMSVFYLEV